jgi:hypothetical protein
MLANGLRFDTNQEWILATHWRKACLGMRQRFSFSTGIPMFLGFAIVRLQVNTFALGKCSVILFFLHTLIIYQTSWGSLQSCTPSSMYRYRRWQSATRWTRRYCHADHNCDIDHHRSCFSGSLCPNSDARWDSKQLQQLCYGKSRR